MDSQTEEPRADGTAPPVRFQVVLVEPEIPFNTGAVGRLCVATGSPLHLIGRLGFQLDDKHLKRAGLDYWPHLQLTRWPDLDTARAQIPAGAWHFFSTHGSRCLWDARFQVGDVFVFGSESRGLPKSLVYGEPNCWRLPILDPRVRSLNLSTAVAVTLYEALRQCGVREPSA